MNRRTAVAATLAGIAPQGWAQAEPYPSRPLKIIVPTPPGGGADTLARVVGQRLSETMKQPVVIENRPGAAGNNAAEQVKRMAPDGYTIFIGAIAILAISPSLYKSLPFDPVKDFTPISMGVILSNVLVAHPSLPANNVRELIALAKAKPGTINFSSSGNATSGHLAGELFGAMTGTKLVHVPYKGGGPSIADLIAGHVQISFASPPSALPHVKAGKLKVLGVTTETRQAAMPEVPTIAESGVPGFSANNWYCFVGPAGIPRDIVARLNQEIRAAMADPGVQASMAAQGMVPEPSTPEALTQIIVSEMDKWGKVIRAGNFTPD
ncbi:MAG: tripartite tricarboxylate transporter substrate binding protein [Rhodoferax sp.]